MSLQNLKNIMGEIDEIINDNPKLKRMIEESRKVQEQESKEGWLFKDLEHENLSGI